MLYERREDGADHEDGENNVLQSLGRAVGLEEGETDEQTGADTEHPFGQDVGWCSPVLLEGAACDPVKLRAERHGEFGVSTVVGLALDSFLFLVNLLNLAEDSLRLFTLVPECWPLLVFVALGMVHDFQHVFCRILLVVAVSSTVALEIVQHGTRVLSNGSKVYSMSTLCEEQKTVECLEEDGARLMDGTEDSLTVVGQLAKEGADSPGGLRVETTVKLLVRILKIV